MEGPRPRVSWTVTLICGAAGVGKTTIARTLAFRYGASLVQADDIVTALQAVTTPQQLPVLHYWETHRDAVDWSVAKLARLHLAVADLVRPGLTAVIRDHIESRVPVVIEGDYLLPELSADFTEDVVTVVLTESSQQRIIDNFRIREPEEPPQEYRAQVSLHIGAELERRATVFGVPTVSASPWIDSADRVHSALRLRGPVREDPPPVVAQGNP